MNPTSTFSHKKGNTLAQNDVITIHLDQRKFAHKRPLLYSGIIKEWFLNITVSKDKQLTVKGTVTCFRISLSQQSKENAVVCCLLVCARVRFCLLAAYVIQAVVLWIIHQIWHPAIFTSFGPWKRSAGTILPVGWGSKAVGAWVAGRTTKRLLIPRNLCFGGTLEEICRM
jgi:hypothetical protein